MSFNDQFTTPAIYSTVVDWTERVKNNGGSVSGNTVMAVNKFWKSIITAGLSSSLYAVNVFVPDNLNASLTPLIARVGDTKWTSNAFVDGDLTVNGLQSDGTSKYLRTGIIPNSFATVTSGHISCYASGSASEGGTFGCTDSGTAQFRFFSNYASASITRSIFFCGHGDSSVDGQLIPSSFIGFQVGTRNPATETAPLSMSIYEASSAQTFKKISHALSGSSVTGSIPVTRDMAVFSTNEFGFFLAFQKVCLSFVSTGTSLTATQASDLYNAVRQLRTEFGGGNFY